MPLIEPTLADVLSAVGKASDLSPAQRQHWSCSLRGVAKGLGKPPELLPARWTALRQPISRLHHVHLGVTAKTLANHKANARAALSWFAREQKVPARGAPLSPDWERLRGLLPNSRILCAPVFSDAVLVGSRNSP